MHSLGVQPATLITALTVQDSHDVQSVHPVDPHVLASQLTLLRNDLPISAVKFGMIGSDAIVPHLVDFLDRLSPTIPIVLDPILRASGGHSLAPVTLRQSISTQLIPRCTLLTPNLAEARQLTGCEAVDDCAAALLASGASWVLITGGDEPTMEVQNLLVGAQGTRMTWQWPRLPHRYHGSGCTLASAVAGFLALGWAMPEACFEAQRWTQQALFDALQFGHGQHFPRRRTWQQAQA